MPPTGAPGIRPKSRRKRQWCSGLQDGHQEVLQEIGLHEKRSINLMLCSGRVKMVLVLVMVRVCVVPVED